MKSRADAPSAIPTSAARNTTRRNTRRAWTAILTRNALVLMMAVFWLLVATIAGFCNAGEVTFGRVRVQALSDTLLRVEPRGPAGFYDNTSFMVVSRAFEGIDIQQINQTGDEAWFSTDHYDIHITALPVPPSPPPSPDICQVQSTNKDIANGARVSEYPDGIANSTQEQCCTTCGKIKDCILWIYDPNAVYCYLMQSAEGPLHDNDRVMGGAIPHSDKSNVSVAVFDKSGQMLYQIEDTGTADTYVNWPAPTTAPAYAVMDRPRFFAPEWGPTPIPSDAHVDPALVGTNGYDFRNDVAGDVYIFLLGKTLDDWHHSRQEFLQLTGPTPQLPDFAFGTWFTYWHQYTQSEAQGEVERWISDQLPIDVWALDMNWRNTTNNQDHFYNHPAEPNLFQNFSAWFEFLEQRHLRTYFNDHPYPVGLQTHPDEVAFRWEGLSHWMSMGLTYWWFDANWKFSIPPPTVDANVSGPSWEGLTNIAWGGHLYYTSVRVYDETQRPADFPRPIVLNKYASSNMKPGLVQHQHSAHHRYPVWWTGDGVDLEASVESMVDSGVHDFKTYVHSDCGGDYRGSAGDEIRWISHCTFGTILRLHGNAHQPWSYDNHTEDALRSYFNMRYQLIPSLITAGALAHATTFPLVVRGDLIWPEYGSVAQSNHQYYFLNDTLVAPIWNSTANVTSRDVWVPPGTWQDAWNGSTTTGPQMLTVSQPYERIPLWHKQGSAIITTPTPGLRTDLQDWRQLSVHIYVGTEDFEVVKALVSRNQTSVSHEVHIAQRAGVLTAHLRELIDQPREVESWHLRIQSSGATILTLEGQGSVHRAQQADCDDLKLFPFGRPGSPSPCRAVVHDVIVTSDALLEGVRLVAE
eukprot:m.161313 g.161313  ORF g.161313 m.161313 type:complete len:861 (-) comp16525_c0_seq1:26-2608(-)